MEDQYNLIYNGKMIYAMDGYANTIAGLTYSMDTSDKPNGCVASYSFPVFNSAYNESIRGYIPVIPYLSEDTYKLSFQFKDNGSTATTQYTCLLPFDNKGKYVNIPEVYPYWGGNTITTLTQDLKDGDTIIHLASVTNWSVDQNYFVFGVIESAAYGDNRALAYVFLGYGASIDSTNNTITLGMTTNGGSTQYTWQGGTYKAGSKVREFSSGSTYIYPMTWTDKPSSWTLKEITFAKTTLTGNGYPERLNASYFLGFGTIYTKGKIADLRFENLSRNQIRIPNGTETIQLYKNSGHGIIDDYSESTSSVNQYGQLNTGMLSEGFLPVRYIRDSINGSDKSINNIWREIQAFDRWGRNVAFAADGTVPGRAFFFDDNDVTNTSRYGLNNANTTTFKPLHCITQGIYHNGYIQTTNTTFSSVTIDMGIVHYIDKIIIWHYHNDSRTFHDTKTEVSVDGVNWITVFDSAIEGEYVETADGHTITFDKLGTLYYASMRKGGEVLVEDIYEI